MARARLCWSRLKYLPRIRSPFSTAAASSRKEAIRPSCFPLHFLPSLAPSPLTAQRGDSSPCSASCQSCRMRIGSDRKAGGRTSGPDLRIRLPVVSCSLSSPARSLSCGPVPLLIALFLVDRCSISQCKQIGADHSRCCYLTRLPWLQPALPLSRY